MENVPEGWKMKFNDMKAAINKFQTDGTPIRSLSKDARESIEKTYNQIMSKSNQLEVKVNGFTAQVDNVIHNNAHLIDYCRLHPAVTIFGSTSLISIPSFFSKFFFSFDCSLILLIVFDCFIVFGLRGMMFSAIGTVSLSTLFVGGLMYRNKSSSEKSHHH